MAFQGTVDRFSLADVFQSLALKQRTGTLCVYVQDGPERRLYFETGHVRALDSGRQKPLRLGEILVGRGVLTQKQLDAALERQNTSRHSLGHALAEMNLLDPDTLDEFLARQIEEGILELLAWENARYQFIEGPPPEAFFGDRLARSAPFLSATQLLLEAGRRVDQWEHLRREIPSFREIFVVEERCRDQELPGGFESDATEYRLMPWLDGTRDVEDLIEDSCLFRFEVLSGLAVLKQAQAIRPATVEELKMADRALAQGGQSKRRVKVLERLLAYGVDRAVTRLALVELMAEAGDTEKAAGHLGLLAEEALAERQPEQAMAHLRRGIGMAPQHLPLRERLGALHVQRKEPFEAIQQYDQLERSYCERRQWAEARVACQQILVLDPSDSTARRALIEICMELGDRASAVRECETLSEVLHRQNLPDDAASYLRRAVEIEPQRKDLQKKLGQLNRRPKQMAGRSRATVWAIVVIIAISLGLPTRREFLMWRQASAALRQAEALRLEAEALEKTNDFPAAAARYDAAVRALAETTAAQVWTLMGQQQKLEAVAADLRVRSQQARGPTAQPQP
jgi:tetratricopeptide (TPR) repeat protein